MDSERLKTASTYLNNLLLARGLLRNGEPVDFVKPSKESRAQIINLVHDLVLRGDRDKEQREHTTITVRQLRTEDSRKTQEIERLTAKHDESARSAVQAQSAERTANEESKKTEKAMRGLQEQLAKVKSSLAQVKTQCANDIRKRDVELARLKTHLQGQQRGNKTAVSAPSITITGGAMRPAFDASVRDIGDPEYTLKQETTDFLTQLSQSLSDENDNLINLVRGSLRTLRELLGLSDAAKGFPDSGIGEDVAENRQGDRLLHALPTSYDTLAKDLKITLSHLKELLTNPNFVPLEEVEVREEEIARLREGWEKMEQRWKDLLVMMDGWRKRMDTGGTIKIDDLRQGLGLVSPDRETKGVFPGVSEVDDNSSLIDDSLDDIRRSKEESDVAPAEAKVKILSATTDHILSSGKASVKPGWSSPKRKRDVLEPPESFDLRPRGAAQRDFMRTRATEARPHGTATKASTALASNGAIGRTSTAPMAELFNDGDESEELEVPQMTIEEKLSAVAEEAAAVREMQVDAPFHSCDANLDGTGEERADEDTLGQMPSPARKTKIKGRPRRRKSTLSRDELADLLLSAEG